VGRVDMYAYQIGFARNQTIYIYIDYILNVCIYLVGVC